STTENSNAHVGSPEGEELAHGARSLGISPNIARSGTRSAHRRRPRADLSRPRAVAPFWPMELSRDDRRRSARLFARRVRTGPALRQAASAHPACPRALGSIARSRARRAPGCSYPYHASCETAHLSARRRGGAPQPLARQNAPSSQLLA